MRLNLKKLMKRAEEYVELEGDTKVLGVQFEEKFTLFGREDIVLSVITTESDDPEWWVVGGSSPMNLYSKKQFPSADGAFTFHSGLMLRLADRDFKKSEIEPEKVGYDAFISHASEDKHDFVRPLAEALDEMGFGIWYDEFELKVGDSLRESIDRGLINSSYGIVILSKAFFAKNWSQYELNGLTAREIEGKKVILPIWYNINKQDVLEYSPSLADKFALNNQTMNIDEIAEALAEILAK